MTCLTLNTMSSCLELELAHLPCLFGSNTFWLHFFWLLAGQSTCIFLPTRHDFFFLSKCPTVPPAIFSLSLVHSVSSSLSAFDLFLSLFLSFFTLCPSLVSLYHQHPYYPCLSPCVYCLHSLFFSFKMALLSWSSCVLISMLPL